MDDAVARARLPAGLVAGMRIFPYVSERHFRQLTLLLLTAVSTGILLA